MKRIIVQNPEDFSPLVASHIRQAAEASSREIAIGIPGGRGAIPVVAGILQCEPDVLQRVQLYLVDERLSGDKNVDTLLDVGLQQAIDAGLFSHSQIHSPHVGTPFMNSKRGLELLYLGIGEDGHMASLFPGSYPELDAKDVADVVKIDSSPKPPPERVTISYRGLRLYAKRSRTYVLFFGEGKRIALERFLDGQENPSSLPCMYFPREWFSFDVVTDIKGV
jgi:6-phosphogluconolactonase